MKVNLAIVGEYTPASLPALPSLGLTLQALREALAREWLVK
jgi:hypothetical protein